MQWLDREFWNLYRMAANARPAPPPSGEILNQCRVAVEQSSILRISGTETVSPGISSVSAASEWSSDEQRRLEAALVSHPSSLEPKERWRSISADVGSKTAGQCIARFKFIRDTLKSGGSVGGSVAADTLKSGGSVAAAVTKSALVSVASDKNMAPTKLPVPASVVSAAASAAASESSMPPIEIPDDLLTMSGVIAGAGMCSGMFPPLHDVCMNFKIFPSVRMEDVVYDGWDVSVAHTVSLQVTPSLTLLLTTSFCTHFSIQIQCQRCKCRLAIVFPPEGVPSLDMLLDSGSLQNEAMGSEGSDDDDESCTFSGGQSAEVTSATDDPEHNQEDDETRDCEGASSDEDSDADNGMGRKTGVVRVMVESFADRCVNLLAVSLYIFLNSLFQRVALGWLVPRLSSGSRCRCPPSACARNEFDCCHR
jgi:hypothetical protein